MSEPKPEYTTEAEEALQINNQKAAIIERPRTVHGIGENGLEEYQIWGWVKMSAKFCAHIRKLRGAKLAIWMCLALNIDENGECDLTQKELCTMTGYSHTEVIDSVNELDEMGYLSVNRGGKKNLYRPVFVARGGSAPSQETLVKKLDSTPADSLDSSLSLENPVPSSSRVKRVNTQKVDLVDAELQYNLKPTSIRKAVHDYFRLNVNWETKMAREWMEWAVGENVTAEQIRVAAELWSGDKRFNWKAITLKNIFEFWPLLMDAVSPAAEPAPKQFPTLVNGRVVR